MFGKDSIKVAIRVRPLNSKEDRYQKCIEILNEGEIILKPEFDTRKKSLNNRYTQKTLKFNYIADPTQSQENFFNRVGKEIVEYCLKGYNGTIFSYGQTGSGKTFTIQGLTQEKDTKSPNRGLMHRSFEYIFDNLDRFKSHGEFDRLIKCSYLEIYNENVYDLLDPSKPALKIRMDVHKGPYVEGAIEEIITTASQANRIIAKGAINRHISCTKINKNSSRSHAVMTLRIETKKMQEGISDITASSFNIIDLAGSERATKTGARGDTLTEAKNINKSLLCLGNVILNLSKKNQGINGFVNYRGSQLTLLLSNSLGGNAKTLMVANISPASSSYSETNSTLQFAQNVMLVKNNAIINQDSLANVSQLKSKITELQLKIYELEFERDSLKCDLSGEEEKYENPESNDRVSESMLEKKTFNRHIKNKPRTQFQTFSPSMVSELDSEEVTGDAKLVKKVKKIQNFIKLGLDQSVKKDELYQNEIDKRDVHISNLEATVEAYDECLRKDQILLSSRDKTIDKLKNSSKIDLEDFKNHQIDLLSEEKKHLEFKIANNPELGRLKSKCSKLENQIEENSGDCKIERLEPKEVLSSAVNLNRMTLECLGEMCKPEAESQIHTSGRKNTSKLSFLPPKNEHQLEEELKFVKEKLEQQNCYIEVLNGIIISKNSEIKDNITEIEVIKNFNEVLTERLSVNQEQLPQKREFTEQKRERINPGLPEDNYLETTLESDIKTLKDQNSYLSELYNLERQKCIELEKELNKTKKQLDDSKEDYANEVKTIKNEYEHMDLQKCQFDNENSALNLLNQDLEEHILKLFEENGKLIQEMSYKNSIYYDLNNAYEALKAEYDNITSNFDQLHEILGNKEEEINKKQDKINQIYCELEYLQQKLEDQKDFQTEYYGNEDKLKILSENLNQKSNELEALGYEYEDSMETIDALRVKLDNYDTSYNSLKDTNYKLNEDIANLTGQIFENDKNLEYYQQMMEDISIKAEDISKDMYTKLNEMENSESHPSSYNITEEEEEEKIILSTSDNSELQQSHRDTNMNLGEKIMNQLCIINTIQVDIFKENEKLREVLEQKEATLDNLKKRVQRPHNPEMERLLLEWINSHQNPSDLSRETVSNKAVALWKSIRDPKKKSKSFVGSPSWLKRFEKDNELNFK